MCWLTVTSVLLFVTIASALDPPTLLWEREYFTNRSAYFYHVIETSDGGFAIAAAVPGINQDNRPVIKFDSSGNMIWFAGNEFYAQAATWVIELEDSSLVATGAAVLGSGESNAVYIVEISPEGEVIWTRTYDISTNSDFGTCLIQLPDDGYAVCGYSGGTDALLMRTDANGDTLWTRIYDTGHAEKAFRVLYWDNGLTVYVDGGQANRPILLRYDMDGNLIWERTFGTTFPLPMDWGGDICMSSNSGYMIVSSSFSHIARTDWLGYVIWQQPIPYYLLCCGLSLNPTMDGGYIFSPLYLDEHSPPSDIDLSEDGWLVKLDSLGNAEWHIRKEMGVRTFFNCARQLQGGGYIVAGRTASNGYLLRYAPETGIEEGEVSPSVTFGISPNPFSASLGISYSLPEPGQAELSVYDLSGRLVENLVSGSISAGENTSVWNPDPIHPAGCYLVVLDACGERAVRRCVKL